MVCCIYCERNTILKTLKLDSLHSVQKNNIVAILIKFESCDKVMTFCVYTIVTSGASETRKKAVQ